VWANYTYPLMISFGLETPSTTGPSPGSPRRPVTINDKPLKDGLFFEHKEFVPGGNLHFVMSDTPPQK
jgi:hypothetical protein